MAFDLASAKPVTGGFDLASAKPVEADDPAAKEARLAALDAEGVPRVPADQPPAAPRERPPGLLSGGPLPAIESGVRGLVGGTAAMLGGIGGLLDFKGTNGAKPLDPESHAQAANAEAQRAMDLVMGKQSPESQRISQSFRENMPKELQALPGMSGEMGALSAAARGVRLPNMPKVPGIEAARGAIDKARGIPATAEAEALRTRSLATAAESAQRAREAAQRATDGATRAGLDAEHAGAWGAAAQNNLESAAKVGDEIERQLLARPTMGKEELGAMMRAAGTTLRDQKIAARRAAAGYDQATAQDGAKIVPLDAARSVIDAEKESLKNPNLRATLDRVNKELTPTGPAPAPGIVDVNGRPFAPPTPQGMTLTQAESLRDYLNDAIAEKSGTAMSAADKSSQRVLLDIKDALTAAMESTSPLWKQANKDFAKASRGELDYLTGKGDLAKTLQTDSLSGQYMQTEAQVTGHIIAKANAGSPVLEMLVKQSPEIKDAARMYYTGELFGKGAMPTPGVMETFVKTNERSLKQLGLFDEFKDIASAQRARLKTIEDFKRQATAAKSAEANATKAEGQATTQAAKHQRIADRFTQFQTEIANVPPKQLPGHIKALGKALQDDGLITQEQYGQMIRESDAAAGGFEDAAKQRALLLKIGGIIGLGVVGHETVKHAL